MRLLLIAAAVSVVSMSILSCRKQRIEEMDEMKNMSIDYAAAFVVNGEGNSLSVIRLSDHKVTETIGIGGAGHGGGGSTGGSFPHHIYYHANANAQRLAVALPGMDLSGGHNGGMPGMKGRVLVLNARNAETIKEFEVPRVNHNAIFSPDGSEIWTSQMEANGKVLVYDSYTYAIKHIINVGSMPAEVTFSADGSKAYVANGGSDNVTIINPTTKAVITTVPVDHNPVAAWVGYDGRMYVDNEEGKTVTVIDVATNAVVQVINLGYMPGSVAHNPFKHELWVSDPNGGKVHYWTRNASTNLWVKAGMFDAAAGVHAIAFTNDGLTAYVTNQVANSVSVINVNTHTKTRDIAVGKKPNGIVIKY